MFELGIAFCTNLFRTYIMKRFMTLFFEKKEERKYVEVGVYSLFFLLTLWAHVRLNGTPNIGQFIIRVRQL